MISIGAFSLPGLLLNAITHGYFFKHLFLYTATQIIFDTSVLSFFVYILPLILFGILAIGFIVNYIGWDSCKTPEKTFILLYFCLSCCSLVLLFKAGSSGFYLIEFTAVCILAGGAGGKLLLEKIGHYIPNYRMYAQNTLLVFLALSMIYPWFTGNTPYLVIALNYNKLLSHIFDREKEVFTRVKNTPGRVLSEDISYLVLCNKNPEWNPFMITQLSERDIISDEIIRREIRNKKFDFIIFDTAVIPKNGKISFSIPQTQRFTAGIIQDILNNYMIVPDRSYVPSLPNKFIGMVTILYPRSNQYEERTN